MRNPAASLKWGLNGNVALKVSSAGIIGTSGKESQPVFAGYVAGIGACLGEIAKVRLDPRERVPDPCCNEPAARSAVIAPWHSASSYWRSGQGGACAT